MLKRVVVLVAVLLLGMGSAVAGTGWGDPIVIPEPVIPSHFIPKHCPVHFHKEPVRGPQGPQGIPGKNGVVNYTKVDKQISAGDKATLSTSEQYTNVKSTQTLTAANSYTNEVNQATYQAAESYSTAGDQATLQQANANAQGYAAHAQANAENYAQGAANQAQENAEQFAASGIAAALAMPSSPVLAPGQLYVGAEMGTYDSQQAIGAKATYQITRRWNANVGVSGGFGQYGHTAVAAGVGYTFGN